MTTWAQSMIIAFKLLKHSRRLNKMLVKFLCKCVINRGNWYSMYMHFLSDSKTSHRLYYTDIQRERWINYSSNQKMFQTTSVKTMIFQNQIHRYFLQRSVYYPEDFPFQEKPTKNISWRLESLSDQEWNLRQHLHSAILQSKI